MRRPRDLPKKARHAGSIDHNNHHGNTNYYEEKRRDHRALQSTRMPQLDKNRLKGYSWAGISYTVQDKYSTDSIFLRV